MGKNFQGQKKQKNPIIQLTIIQCKQRYTHTSLSSNVAVVDLR
jgi:hypothetical protein